MSASESTKIFKRKIRNDKYSLLSKDKDEGLIWVFSRNSTFFFFLKSQRRERERARGDKQNPSSSRFRSSKSNSSLSLISVLDSGLLMKRNTGEPASKLPVKLEIVEDFLEEENGPVNKRSRVC